MTTITHYLFLTRDNTQNSIAVLNDDQAFIGRVCNYLETTLAAKDEAVREKVLTDFLKAMEPARTSDLIYPVIANEIHLLVVNHYAVRFESETK